MITHYSIALVVASFIIAVLGSLMAVLLTREALSNPFGRRKKLVSLAALCLGGVAIWSMHFIGMLALSMPEMAINYNWWLTGASFVISVSVVYGGLTIVTSGDFYISKLLLSGCLVGLGVVVMHYSGMFAMQMQAQFNWNVDLVALSVAIGLVASVAALWLATHVKHLLYIIGSAVVMAVAVCGMHYTGMAAITFSPDYTLQQVEPMQLSNSIFSLVIVLLDTVILIMSFAQVMAEANSRKFSTMS